MHTIHTSPFFHTSNNRTPQLHLLIMSDTTKPTYHYWAGVASRGHYLFYTLGYNGKLDDIIVKGDQPYPGTPEWASGEGFIQSKMGQLPVLTDEGDVSIGQGRAILNYLCKKFSIGQDLSLADYGKSEELVEQANDIHNLLGKAHYGADRTVSMNEIFASGGPVEKVLNAYEDHVGGAVAPGHCCFAAALNLLVRLEPECLAKNPKIKAFYDEIQANEGIKTVNERCPYPYFKRNSN